MGRSLFIVYSLAVVSLGTTSLLVAQDNVLDTGLDDFSALQITRGNDARSDETTSPMPLVLDENLPAAVKSSYAKGQQLAAQGDFAAAIAEFNQAVEADPTFALGFLARARGLAALKQSRLAIKSYGKALTLADDAELRATIYRERGTSHFDAREFQKALDDFDRAAELQPGSAHVAYQRGRTLMNLAAEEFAAGIDTAGQSITEAVAAFDRAIKIQPDFVDALADRGSARGDLGETDEAIDDLTKANSLRKEASLQYRLALLHLQRAAGSRGEGARVDGVRQTDLHKAISLLTSAMEPPGMEPVSAGESVDQNQLRLTRAVARIELASLLEASARVPLYRAALDDCTAVVDDSPRLGAAHYQRGIALRLLGDDRGAVDAFTEAIKLAPENSEARIRRGIAWFYLDEFDLALNDFRAVGLVPGDARPMFWTGVIHAQRDDHLEAIRAYSEAISENRGYRLAYANRALSLMHLGHWQRAIDDFNEMIQLNPGDSQAYHRRGLAQQQLGRDDEARRSFAKAR